MPEHVFSSSCRGYHVYQSVWRPQLDEELEVQTQILLLLSLYCLFFFHEPLSVNQLVMLESLVSHVPNVLERKRILMQFTDGRLWSLKQVLN